MYKSDAPASLASVLAQSPALNNRQRIAWSTWRSIVGHRIAMHTMPLRVDNDTLNVVVSSSLWASELSLLQAPILTKLRTVLPHVAMLRFRVGKVEVPADTPPPVRVHSAPLPPDLEERLGHLEDDALRRAIEEAARYSLGRASEPRPAAFGSSLQKPGNKPF